MERSKSVPLVPALAPRTKSNRFGPQSIRYPALDDSRRP